MSEMDDVVREFLTESQENLDHLDRDFVALERTPDDRETLARIFRTVHTIKGTCGFLGFSNLEGVSHVGENLLSLLCDGRLRLTAEVTTVLLNMVDAVRTMLGAIEAVGSDGADDYADLRSRLGAIASSYGGSTSASQGPSRPEATPLAPPEPHPAEAAAIPSSTVLHAPSVAIASQGPSDVTAVLPSVTETAIRVDVALLDRLMNLVGELVLARNQILQHSALLQGNAFLATTQRLNLITTELQEAVMKTRMQPIGNVWGKFPRLIRDLAVSCGKQVRLKMDGRETELDRTLLEAIKDPLTHIVRNAVDHGIEPPEVRQALGKPPEGTLCLRAYHEGGQVNLEITDDGGGISPERVRRKAIDRGLLTADRASRMNDREILSMIFLPGFSTAEKITNVSGRGVGMDVVKTNIEKIGGIVDLQSVPGSGTTIKIKIPLTLAIIPALIVTVAGERYAIPQVSLLELVRLEGEDGHKKIERIHRVPVHRLRGALLPLVDLRRELGLPQRHGADENDVTNIVVLHADERQFGLVVDGINDTEEIVVKPIGKHLKGIPVFAGATIRGDGRVALILDALGLAQQSGVISRSQEMEPAVAAATASRSAPSAVLESLLVVACGNGGRVAIPLSMVARLEKIPMTAVEHSAGKEVVQYRGEIMPLVRLSSLLGTGGWSEPENGQMSIVVYTENGRSIGIIVDKIIDIVEEPLTLAHASGNSSSLGAAVVQRRITDLLHIRALLNQTGMVASGGIA